MVLNRFENWPESASPGTQFPPSIEGFLRAEITRRQISLVGELDLVEPTVYAGIGWSLLDLANYLVSKPIIRSTLTDSSTWSNGIWPYPATLAIWSVGHAQTAKDGTKLWELDGYSSTQKTKLAELFFQSIGALGLETFEGELEKAQKYVQLARIHAMIPDFAIDRYSEIINRGVKYNRPKKQILNEVTTDALISKGVQRLFSGNPNIGLDLIERSFNYLAYGYYIDLPERIKSRLSKEVIKKSKISRSINFPQVKFVEWERSIEVRGVSGWRLEDKFGNALDNRDIPATEVFTCNQNSERIELLNPKHGFLIFDLDGNLTDSRYLPSDGGFLLWHSATSLLSEIPHLDPGYISGTTWQDWQYTFFQSLPSLKIQLFDGETRFLTERKSVELKVSPVSHLVNANRDSVFMDYPRIEEKQFLKVTNNLTGDQWNIDDSIGAILNGPGGEIDVTVSAGLGKSKTYRGLVIPGIRVRGLESALKQDERRKILINFSPDWKVTFPIDMSGRSEVTIDLIGDPKEQIPMLKVTDPAGAEHFVGIEVPILSWSVEYRDRENAMVASELKHKIEDRRHVQALILHEVDDYVPVLKVGESFVTGRKRGRDVRYDLRFLQEEKREVSTVISISWNYEELDLISFRHIPTRQSFVIKDLRDLPEAALKAGTISLESWTAYQASKSRESRDLKERTRYLRGR